MPFVVGLTGGIGSGKSAVGRLFTERGATLVDADAESHALTAAGGGAIAAIRREFGDSYIAASGALDRARTRALVFAEPAARRRLESILHPLIQAACDVQVREAAGPYVILMIPLLVESGHPRRRAHRIAVVDCSEEHQIRRVMARDGLSREAVMRTIAAQATRDARRAAADDIIDNDGPPAALAPQVEALHDVYLRAARSGSWPWPPAP